MERLSAELLRQNREHQLLVSQAKEAERQAQGLRKDATRAAHGWAGEKKELEGEVYLCMRVAFFSSFSCLCVHVTGCLGVFVNTLGGTLAREGLVPPLHVSNHVTPLISSVGVVTHGSLPGNRDRV